MYNVGIKVIFDINVLEFLSKTLMKGLVWAGFSLFATDGASQAQEITINTTSKAVKAVKR
ncbi:MAG: hypothetical protein J6V69_03285 [Clostridia bacterium]|nr:hypothetical protein [Clostridia bacterium]